MFKHNRSRSIRLSKVENCVEKIRIAGVEKGFNVRYSII